LCLEEKVAAVAIATVASQVISAFLVSFRLLSIEGACRVNILRMRFGIGALGKVLAAGLPMALVHALFPLSNLQIQSAINSHGVAAIAGNGAVSTIESVVSAFTGPIGTSASVFIGQNIGAKKRDRVKRSFWMCMLFAVVIGGGIGVFTYLTGRFWLSLIVGADAAAIEYGLTRMFCTTLFHVVAAINGVFASAILAHGFSVASAINSIFSVFVFRVVWMQTVYPKSETFWSIVVCFIVSWALRMMVNIVLYGFIWRGYRKKMSLPPCEE
jgi:Na+-driven multidrug efflux pump